jgi:hypothetical protein
LRTDITPVLESIQAPTMVARRRGDRDLRRDHVVDIAERIPHARLVEFDGDDSVWFAGDADGVLDEIESFLTGVRVHIAARIMALAAAGEVLVSGVIPPLVLGSRLTFTDRGNHELKGVPGYWSVLAVDYSSPASGSRTSNRAPLARL